MKITLLIDEKEKTFTNGFVKGIILRKALELNKEILESGIDLGDPATYDRLVEFVVNAFDRQFTVDEVWNGLSADKLQEELVRIFHGVLALGGLQVQHDEVVETGK